MLARSRHPRRWLVAPLQRVEHARGAVGHVPRAGRDERHGLGAAAWHGGSGAAGLQRFFRGGDVALGGLELDGGLGAGLIERAHQSVDGVEQHRRLGHGRVGLPRPAPRRGRVGFGRRSLASEGQALLGLRHVAGDGRPVGRA
jgi:hypothetical protein